MKNAIRTLPAVLALTGALFWLTPAPPVEAREVCLPLQVCVTFSGVRVCVTVGEVCV